MTPDEINRLAEGFKKRERLARERDAWMLANVIQPHTKKRIRAKDFLNTEPNVVKYSVGDPVGVQKILDKVKRRCQQVQP